MSGNGSGNGSTGNTVEKSSSVSVLSQIKKEEKDGLLRPSSSRKSTSGSATLPRVASLRSTKKAGTVPPPFGFTVLPCGEKVPKNHKCLTASGSIEEVIGGIGKLKATHFNLEDTNARKMFIFARLTRIQEDLFGIIRSITTTPLIPVKHTTSRFSMDKVKDLEDATSALGTQLYTGTPGASTIEADIYLLWAVVRRCERQLFSAKDPSIGIIVEESTTTYMNKLSDYFSALIPHMLGKF